MGERRSGRYVVDDAEILEKTERLMEMFREVNVKSDKLLFKIPATWEACKR